MKISVKPCKLRGSVVVPPSKSVAHRAIIAAALSVWQNGANAVTVGNIQLSEDIEATLNCIRNLGCDFKFCVETSEVAIKPCVSGVCGDVKQFDCGESGSTLRFFIPIALAMGGKSMFTGRGRLLDRPQTPYFEIFDKLGIRYRLEGGKLNVDGRLRAGEYQVSGDISSQFITGLMFALTMVDGNSSIALTTELSSRAYVDLTLDALREFGVEIVNNNYEKFTINVENRYKARDYCVEGDYSQAAFWLVANEIGNEITCKGLNINSLQGDKAIVDIISGKVETDGDYVNIDVDEFPDLVPILAVYASLAHKNSRLVNAGRLRIKESDRLNAIATELNKLGGRLVEGEDWLEIEGVSEFRGGEVSAHNDHRIAMALAIAATRASGVVTIDGAESVRKSYPNFWEDYAKLGGEVV